MSTTFNKPNDIHNLRPRRICTGEHAERKHATAAMECLGDTVTDKGSPCVAYVCPICGYEEYWVLHRDTQEPIMLFHKAPGGRKPVVPSQVRTQPVPPAIPSLPWSVDRQVSLPQPDRKKQRDGSNAVIQQVTSQFFSSLEGLDVGVLVDGENFVNSARKHKGKYRVNFSLLANLVRKSAYTAELHIVATGTNERDAYGGPFLKPWKVHFRQPKIRNSRLEKSEKSSNGYLAEVDRNSDPRFLCEAGCLVEKRKIDVLVLGTGDSRLIQEVAELVDAKTLGRTKVMVLALPGTVSNFLIEGKNPLVSQTHLIGMDLLLPASAPRAIPKATFFERVWRFAVRTVGVFM